eukprot:6456681-Amphidinium_carterae.2
MTRHKCQRLRKPSAAHPDTITVAPRAAGTVLATHMSLSVCVCACALLATLHCQGCIVRIVDDVISRGLSNKLTDGQLEVGRAVAKEWSIPYMDI